MRRPNELQIRKAAYRTSQAYAAALDGKWRVVLAETSLALHFLCGRAPAANPVLGDVGIKIELKKYRDSSESFFALKPLAGTMGLLVMDPPRLGVNAARYALGAVYSRLTGGKEPFPVLPRRKHSRFSSVRCDICSPLRCSKAK